MAPVIAPYAPSATGGSIGSIFQPPSEAHPLGTDEVGHDVLSMALYGGRVSMAIGLTSALISVLLGTLVGVVSGYYGKTVDVVLMRIVDIILTLPRLVLLIALTAVMGPNLVNIILLLGLTGWCETARIVRSKVLSVRKETYVEAAHLMGSSQPYILYQHILRNVALMVLPVSLLTVAKSILSESTLAFIGLGDVRFPSWGLMLHYAFSSGALSANAYWYVVTPGACLVITILSFVLAGFSLDEVLNPKIGKI
jgi:peptide/nickel transport system permease protein